MEIEFIKQGGISIPRQYENELWYRKIRADLLRRAQKFNTPDFEILKFYTEDDEYLTVPRFYPIEKFLKLSSVKFKDMRHEGESIHIEHNIKPRNQLQKQAISYMLEHDNGIIQLQPGVGKTVISIYMIAEKKKKSIILVHRDSLAEQWIDRITQFTNLDKNDVIRMTSNNFTDALNYPIIIVTNQTLLSLLNLKRQRHNFLIKLNDANIGIFLADEIHTSIGAPTFSECSLHMPCKTAFGLSATPYRWDGNTDIINYHLGEIFELEDNEGTMSPRITAILVDYGIDVPRRYKYLYWGGQFQRSRYLNLMRKSTSFLNTVKGLLTKFKIDRNILFMSERINLIDLLYDWLEGEDRVKFIAGVKNDVLKRQIVLTTPGKSRDGIDIPEKDCLILTSPIKNVAQVCGRVLRIHPNKQTPIIIDMIDIGSRPIRNTFWGRKKYYKKYNWPINYMLINKDGVKVIDEDYAYDIIKGT